MFKLKTLLVGLVALIALGPTAFAASGDLSLSESNIKFSQSYFLEGTSVRIWASVQNNSDYDLLGSVRFSTQDGVVGSDQPVSALAGSTDDVFMDWTPNAYGYHSVTITIYPWDTTADDPSNNTVQKTIYVEMDTDNDGIANSQDDDDDNDGVIDEEDLYPLDKSESADTDGDGTGDNADEDDDNDGVLDEDDDLPLDPLYSSDQDGDGIADEIDDDLDGDGLSNEDELDVGTSSGTADSDGDRVNDGDDPFPTDPSEWADYDGDGTGDNSDTDIDGDGMINEEDPAPSNKAPQASVEQDVLLAGIGDTVTFDASNSADEDGEIVSYEWEFTTKDGAVETASGPIVQKTFTESGLQNVMLTVGDDSGQSSQIKFGMRVLNYNFLLFALLFALILISLAFYLIYRYNSRASGETSGKTVKKTVKKTTKHKKKTKAKKHEK
jgi:hypothetical protein